MQSLFFSSSGLNCHIGFKSGKAYAVENERGKSIVVDNYVIAAHGNAKREWPWIACSESNFTEVRSSASSLMPVF